MVSATFEGLALGPYDILIDILVAQRLLREVMELYDHKNLDTLPEFAKQHPQGTAYGRGHEPPTDAGASPRRARMLEGSTRGAPSRVLGSM